MKHLLVQQLKVWIVVTFALAATRVLLSSSEITFPAVWVLVFFGLIVSVKRLDLMRYVIVFIAAHIALGVVGYLAIEIAQKTFGHGLLFGGRAIRIP